MQKVVILGAGPFAKEVYWCFHDANQVEHRWEVLGYIDDNKEKHGQVICGIPVLGDFSWFEGVDRREIKVICGAGPGAIKSILVDKVEMFGLDFCSILHPSVEHSFCSEIGHGCVVSAGSILAPESKLKNHVTVNLDVTVGHDNVLEDYSNLAPGVHLSGDVIVKEGADIGTGATVIQGLTIGKWSVIGANASVIRDIPDYVTAVGVPAKVIKKASE